MIELEQSIPICCGLAALGGILEVFATAVLAYPASRSVEGYEWTDRQLQACLAVNILLQILASVAGNLFSTWFGPVAIAGPIFFAAQLLANLVVFWIVLGLEAFSREMQIGTYVIVVAVVLLIVNGPSSQDYGTTTFQELITEFYAMIWACLLTGAMLVTGVILTIVDLRQQQERPLWFTYATLLTARATAFALNLSTGKALILPTNRFWFIVNLVVKIVSGMIYTSAIVVQSTAVEQKVFVPINAAVIVLINALTGIIIWEDWRVVTSWIGYFCVFLLLALGCGLLLGDLGLLQESSPETFMGARVSMLKKENRRELLDRLKHFGQDSFAHHGNKSLLSPINEMLEEQPGMGPNDNVGETNHLNGGVSDTNVGIRSITRRNTIAISNPRSRPIRESPDILSRSDVAASMYRSRSTLFHPRTHRLAWGTVYEGARATSARRSRAIHSLFTPPPSGSGGVAGESPVAGDSLYPFNDSSFQQLPGLEDTPIGNPDVNGYTNDASYHSSPTPPTIASSSSNIWLDHLERLPEIDSEDSGSSHSIVCDGDEDDDKGDHHQDRRLGSIDPTSATPTGAVASAALPVSELTSQPPATRRHQEETLADRV